MLQTTIFAPLFAVSLATVATSQVLSIDIDGDGAPDQLTAHSVNGRMTLSLCRSVGLPLSIQALPPAARPLLGRHFKESERPLEAQSRK